MTAALPVARTPDPRLVPALRWAIMGPGWIGQRFFAALQRHTTQKVVAVGSRSMARAQEFARCRGIPAAYGNYTDLLAAPDVDIVYIATPHIEHRAGALAALAAGKHVLVEKPLGINASEAREVFDAAHAAGLFAGEAMWTKFLPKFDVIRQVLDTGMLGPLRTAAIDNGEYFTPDHRIYNPDLLGGPMLDLGIYPISFAQWVLGEPQHIHAAGQPANERINGQFSALLTHKGGSQAMLTASILAESPRRAFVAGDDGFLDIAGPYYQPGTFTVTLRSGPQLEFTDTACGHEDGLHFSAVEAASRIDSGASESVIHPPEAVIATLATMDRIRAQIAITYPADAPLTGARR